MLEEGACLAERKLFCCRAVPREEWAHIQASAALQCVAASLLVGIINLGARVG
jgi:hypothetical protein